MSVFGEGFELSKWFNGASCKPKPAVSDLPDVEEDFADHGGEDGSAVSPVAIELGFCFVCAAPNPDYLSTNTVKGAPPVPVCSLNCESDYLKQRGWQASKKNGGKYVQLPSSPTESSKKSKRDEEPVPQTVDLTSEERSTKRQRRSFSFLDDHMLESDEGKGYKSWWLGALAFFDFVYQRHGMWHSYSMSNNEPRVDPALIKYWTCNIYRELDRSTAYLRKHVLRWQEGHHGRLSMREVLWMAVVFRYCNRLETFDKAKGIPSSDGFGPFKKRMHALAKRKDDTPLFAGRQDLDVNQYLDILEAFLTDIDDITVSLKACASASSVFETLRQFKDNALGSFTCWQVTCDLIELNLFPEDFVEDDFVWLSVDAKKSLVQIFGKRRARPAEYVSLAKLLEQRQVQAFKALEVRFPFFMGRKLSLKNIGHALHGFQVYRNIKLLEHNQFDRHEPGTSPPVAYASRSYLMDSESCEICAQAENEDELVLCDMCNRLFHKYCIDMAELPPASWVCTPCKALVNAPEEGVVTEPEIISVD
ncbi:hypothetical protein ATCC90586_008098 [Pythium insidiosum]|nr:hypothetical protein ATCC90586_008098 [Pythium insidiosum]